MERRLFEVKTLDLQLVEM